MSCSVISVAIAAFLSGAVTAVFAMLVAGRSFTVSLRTYTWCTQGPPPCDTMSNNIITGGDTASGHLTSSSGDVATGVITKTTDPKQTPEGTITFTVHPGADLISVSGEGDFCGPQAAPGACGA